MQYELTHDVYTPSAIDSSISAFAHLVSARADHRDAYSLVTIASNDKSIDAELLNYVLALSAKELLHQ
jgi:hypothetical protein